MNNALKDYSWLLSLALLAVLGVGCSSVEEKPAPTPPAAAAKPAPAPVQAPTPEKSESAKVSKFPGRRRRRAAGGASRRPDLRHLRPGHGAQSRPHLAAGTPAEIRSHRRWSVPTSAAERFWSVSRAGVRLRQDPRAAWHRPDHRSGEVVALLGPNGAGKTTLLRAVSGLLPWTGIVRFDGRDLRRPARARPCSAGLVHVIEAIASSRRSASPTICCSRLTTCRAASARTRVEEALAPFPRSPRSATTRLRAQRRAATDAGRGARAGARPRLLMLDEPSAGLSPVLVDRVLVCRCPAARAGTAVLLVEQLSKRRWPRRPRLCAGAGNRAGSGTREADLPHRLERAYFGHESHMAVS